MREGVTNPFLFFLTSIVFGVGTLFIYDIFRSMRVLLHHKKIFVVIEDLGFAIFVAIMTFLFLYTYNYGELRGFFFLGIFLGMLFYHGKISSKVRKSLIRVLSIVRSIIKSVLDQIEKPMIYIHRNLKWRLKKEKKNVTMALKRQKRGDRSGTKKKIK